MSDITNTFISEQGPRGVQGIQGPQGGQGPQGIQGTAGIPGLGIPTGGSPGQVVVKKGPTDYDTEWGPKIYDFNGADWGAGHAFFSVNQEGKLTAGGTGQYAGSQERNLAVCPESAGTNKIMNFRIKDTSSYPAIMVHATGTSIAMGNDFKCFKIAFNPDHTGYIEKWTGTGSGTMVKAFSPGNNGVYTEIDVTIKINGKRMHVTVWDSMRGIPVWNDFVDDVDLTTMGTLNGVGNGAANELTEYSNFYFADNVDTGKLIILGGDSQTDAGGVPFSMDTGAWLVRALRFKNVDVINTGVSGRTTQNVLDGLATEVIAKKASNKENIYYINIGTNDMGFADSAAVIKGRLDSIVSQVKAAGFKVMVTTIAYGDEVNPESGKSKEYNDLIRASNAAGAYDYFLDFYAVWGDPVPKSKIIWDNLHFTVQARKEIADLIIAEVGL